MPSSQRLQAFVADVEAGRILHAIETYYADDVVMQDNNAAPTVGKAANLERERGFVGYIAEVHQNTAVSVIAQGDQVAIVWHFEFSGEDGKRLRMEQVAVQQWAGSGDDARIVRERFFYDSATLAVEPAAA